MPGQARASAQAKAKAPASEVIILRTIYYHEVNAIKRFDTAYIFPNLGAIIYGRRGKYYVPIRGNNFIKAWVRRDGRVVISLVKGPLYARNVRLIDDYNISVKADPLQDFRTWTISIDSVLRTKTYRFILDDNMDELLHLLPTGQFAALLYLLFIYQHPG